MSSKGSSRHRGVVVSLLLLLLVATTRFADGLAVLRPLVGAVDSLLDALQRGQEFNNPQNHPLYQKSPNWFPLSETEIRHDRAIELELVEGSLPSDLNGVALRVGPNASPETSFNKKVNGIIDGDGMLHSVRLDGVQNRALYSSGWFDTPRRQFETRQCSGKAYFLRLGEMKGFIGILKLLLTPLKLGIFGQDQLRLGQANTAMFSFDGNRQFVLQENSIPFEYRLFEDGTFESIGYQDFGGVLDFPFGAHPRLDPDTGELFFCGYSPFGGDSALKWGAIAPSNDKNGTTAPRVTRYIPVESPSGGCPFSHDFAMTKNYVLILDNSVRFDFSKIRSGDVIQLDQNCPLRFGICLKTATSADEILWFTYDKPAVLVHFVNAWEEQSSDGDGSSSLIRLWAPIWNQFVGDVVTMKDDPSSVVRMTEFTFDLNDPQRRIRTRDVKSDTTTNMAVDFPVVNHNFVGRKARYAFAGIMKRSVIDFDGISKWCTDEEAPASSSPTSSVVKNIFYGDGVTGGEPIVAPKVGKGDTKSDAVYVINFIYDANTAESYLIIYDGEDDDFDGKKNVVAKYRMPHRVPHGLHAKWVEANQLLPCGSVDG